MRRAARVSALVVALAVTACSESKPASTPTGPPASPAATAPPADVDVEVAVFQVETVGVGPEQFESARPKINDLLDRYVNRGTVEPLRTAQPASDLESLFSDSAVERLKGPERVALVDEGLPKADDVRVEEALAGVVLLGTGPGSGVAVAALRVKVTARVGTTPLTITRSVELTLAAEGDEWKIRGFQVAVSRDTPVGVTTTAAP